MSRSIRFGPPEGRALLRAYHVNFTHYFSIASNFAVRTAPALRGGAPRVPVFPFPPNRQQIASFPSSPDLPCAVGFGVSTPDQAAALAHTADGVIVGSAIVTLAQQYGREAVPHIRDYVADMKAALARP